MNKKNNKKNKIESIIQSLSTSKVNPIEITQEMRQSFLDYSMSVITARAIPDVRDGLKPVHRRILFTAFERGFTSDKRFHKSANLVGLVMGYYHPHGDTSIYEALVRLAQDFSSRYPLVEGQGNFGSIDGDKAAAMRYTEVRLSKLGDLFLEGIKEDTVNFMPNYDETRSEPTILPTAIPNILINGALGIAVGMATTIPPHNLTEICNGALALLENPNLSSEEMGRYIQGPDFPTGGEIHNTNGIQSYFETGNGSFYNRAKVVVEEINDRKCLVVQEIPYNLRKENLIKKIVELAKPGKNGVVIKEIEGNINDIRDESSRHGIRLIIELKKEANTDLVLNALYRHSPLQSNVAVNMVMLVNGEPKVLGIIDVLKNYLAHQFEVLVRKTKFNLNKMRERMHLLEGRKVVAENLKAIVELIQEADDVEAILATDYHLTEIQIKDILDQPLKNLKRIERNKLFENIKELQQNIDNHELILSSKQKQTEIITNSITHIRDKFGDERRTIVYHNSTGKINDLSLIPNDPMVITLSQKGYLKRTSIEDYRATKRGGVGIKANLMYEDDDTKMVLTCYAHDKLYFFSSKGKIYETFAYEITQTKRVGRGKPVQTIFEFLTKTETIATILVVNDDYDPEITSLIFATKKGYVKKTLLKEFSKIFRNGKRAISLEEDDELSFVFFGTDEDEILFASSQNRMNRFKAASVRNMGRTARGVRGIKLKENDYLISASSTQAGNLVLSISENGLGKLSSVEDFRLTSRNSQGIIAQKISERSGKMIMCVLVKGDEDIFLITDKGISNRFSLKNLRVMRRNTAGVVLIDMKRLNDQKIVYATKYSAPDSENEISEEEGFVESEETGFEEQE
ncbi:DNA gyrase subunit A [Mycoplasmoides fastidiosum]|uniref:DNA topoisomerase (ATP-hydrolyzing) n=1 Tax=Mycoplasmoides fastidiosum TaxID=92758 RepID=A0ABU0LYP0_9BACT|nr:DNA gyrase subunit A [Mycoplasmoides fastidiosum]MDQ0513805.1 DNA gyrase subunit A [Mycoplasmoides fastidiosum]UUD37777.1 DNA gyrase subunit A [Mycoplasmoides fastidiosum]